MSGRAYSPSYQYPSLVCRSSPCPAYTGMREDVKPHYQSPQVRVSALPIWAWTRLGLCVCGECFCLCFVPLIVICLEGCIPIRLRYFGTITNDLFRICTDDTNKNNKYKCISLMTFYLVISFCTLYLSNLKNIFFLKLFFRFVEGSPV